MKRKTLEGKLRTTKVRYTDEIEKAMRLHVLEITCCRLTLCEKVVHLTRCSYRVAPMIRRITIQFKADRSDGGWC